MKKVRLSGREHLAGFKREIKTHCRTGKGKVGWPGGTRHHLTGDGSSQPGWVRLSGRRVEKVSCLAGKLWPELDKV